MAMTGTSEWLPLMAAMAVVALIIGGGTGGVEAQGAPPQPSGCANSLVSLAPCLSYVTGNGSFSRPSQACCTALASVVKSSAACLCQLVSSTGNPLGIPVNRTAALSLPGACKVTTPPLSQCNKAASAPAQAPAAPGGSSPATAKGGPTPATAPAPSTTQAPNPKAIPSANSPSSLPAPSANIPPTVTEGRNIPSASPRSTSGAATVFAPPMMIMSAFVGVMSAIITVGL